MSTPVAEPVTETVALADPPRLAKGRSAPPSFDAATRQRLRVAGAAADAIEQLVEADSWSRLDPAIAEHLLAQAVQLQKYAARLGAVQAVRSNEDAQLALRRLERRLEVATEHVAGKAAADAAGSLEALFLGDFTEVEREPSERKTTGAPRAPSKQAKAAAEGVPKLTKAQKISKLRENRRLTAYVLIGALAVIGSTGWRVFATMNERPVTSAPPPGNLKPNEYTAELGVFLPIVVSTVKGNDATIVVDKSWLQRTDEQRAMDAEGASVYLRNRNIRRTMLVWDDGIPIVLFDNLVPQWFDEATLTGPGALTAQGPLP